MTSIDQRFDRLEERMDRGFAEVHADITALRTALIQVAFGLVGVVLTALVAVVIAFA